MPVRHGILGRRNCAKVPLAAAAKRPRAAVEQQCTTLAKGTPLDSDSACLSVLSYNLLAPAFVRPIDKRTGGVQPFAAFEWAEPAAEVLAWEVRRPRLLAELRSCGADVLCLQEVQFEQQADGSFALPQWLELDGYKARLPGNVYLQQMAERNKRVLDLEAAIGCAVLYRADRLEVLDDKSAAQPNTLLSICVRGRQATALSALEPVAIFSVHLDAQSEVKRVEQLSKCLTVARQRGVREIIIAGDLNSECLEGSCVAAFCASMRQPSDEEMARECAAALRLGASEAEEGAEGPGSGAGPAPQAPTAEQLQEWRELWAEAAGAAEDCRAALSRVPLGPTRAAYEHGKTCGPCVAWRLDHLLYSARSLELRARWATLEADPESAAEGLPNRRCPSDHLPVAATFRPVPVPRLAAEEEAALLRQLGQVEERHEAESAALQAQLEATRPKAAAEEAAAAAAAAAEQPQGKQEKKKKKASERPAPEVQAHIQECRRQSRQQKELHAGERAETVAALGDLERDALEKHFCLRVWVETGKRQPA